MLRSDAKRFRSIPATSACVWSMRYVYSLHSDPWPTPTTCDGGIKWRYIYLIITGAEIFAAEEARRAALLSCRDLRVRR